MSIQAFGFRPSTSLSLVLQLKLQEAAISVMLNRPFPQPAGVRT
jgi:hypothetical protein